MTKNLKATLATRTLFAATLYLGFTMATSLSRADGGENTLRPPAVPLVTFNPYLSIWSEADKLTDKNTQHWTHSEQSLASLIRIDGKTYRLMGAEPAGVPAFTQISLRVTPTRSIYEFEEAGVHVTLTFMTALLPHDLDVFSRPLSYLTWTVHSVDGAKHQIEIYDSTSSELAVNNPAEPVVWARETYGPLTSLRVGTQAQHILGSSGDNIRIDWGYAYAAAPSAQSASAMGANESLLNGFVQNGSLPATDDSQMPRPVRDNTPVLAFIFDLGQVGAQPIQRQVIVAYDETYAIRYYGRRLQPYWRRNGMTPAELLPLAAREYPPLLKRCEQFDRELMADLTRVGGERYAQICALAYRESIAACGLAADTNKQPLFFTKENTSNGDISTVDVILPMDPIWIFLSPSLAKASVVPVLMYSASPHWKFPNAPHDLGTYPFVFGRDDGGESMPVEESGNMLILCDAIAHDDGNADFVKPWWPQLTQWAEFLKNYGLDPENQLCTDDFMGHLAHNANLSVKAILGLAAYGDLCRMRGDNNTAKSYTDLAKADAAHWMKVADDGDHYRLAFDKPGTWSLKYNLVWDRVLGLNIFPPEVAEKEIAFYLRQMQPLGLPLDSRTKIGDVDHMFFTATMAKNQALFKMFIAPFYDYLTQTTTRDPIVDTYMTDNVKSGGFHARPVVGGFFIKMLTDKTIWHKWSSRDKQKFGNWAPLPPGPTITEIVPTSQRNPVDWRYTTEKPAGDWMEPDFDDSGWKSGPAGFGTVGGAHTRWTTDDIWIRRTFTMPTGDYRHLQFYVFHDEDVEIYVNGVLAGSEGGYTTDYEPLEISPAALSLLEPSAKITMAAHCHQTSGGQYIDIGLANVVEH